MIKLPKMSKIVTHSALFGLMSGILIGAFSGWALAIGEGQIESGDIYRVKNVTKASSYATVQNADKCDTLQYRVMMHNPGPGVVNNTIVKVNLPQTASTTNTSTVSISANNANPSSISASAKVVLSSSQKIAYITGTGQLLNSSGSVISSVGDAIFSGGANIGSVGVSLNEVRYVQFKAKVGCPTPPPPTDVCPNIPGNQTTIPEGKIKDSHGNCVTPPPTDVCPNIDGVQTTVPEGYKKDSTGKCVPVTPPPTDVCPNIPGVQTTVPEGMVKDVNGKCITPPIDVCPNIDGIQATVPEGMIKNADGKCVTPPVNSSGVCKALTIEVVNKNDRQIKAVVSSSVTNAQVVGYTINWGDGNKSYTQTATHSYLNSGSYTVTATVKVKLADGTIVYRTASACSKTVVFEETPPPVNPKYKCDLIELSTSSNRTVKVAKFEYVAKNGASFKTASINWGDGSQAVVSNNLVGQSHKYSKDGEYLVKVTATFIVDGKDVTVSSLGCQKTVKFNTPVHGEKCKIHGYEHLSSDSPDCKVVVVTEPKPPVTNVYITNNNYVTNESVSEAEVNGVSTTKSTEVLPDTGAGSVVAIFAFVTVFSSVGYYALARRFSF